MTETTFDPLAPHRHLARVPSHRGMCSFSLSGDKFSGEAEFLLPADGQAIIALHTPSDLASDDFGADLVIEGLADAGPFRLECGQMYVRAGTPAQDGDCSLSLMSPVNGPVRISYGVNRSVRRAVAVLNNFDFTLGGPATTANSGTRHGSPLVVQAGIHEVTFSQRADRRQLLPLVRAGLLHSAALVQMAFDPHEGESDDDLMAFSADVAALTTFAAGVGVSVAMLDLLDEHGTLVRRIISQPVMTRYRDRTVVEDQSLPRLFSEAFAPYQGMRHAHAPWGKLATYCASLEEAPYLEQKFSSLITAVEFFARNSLIEHGQSEGQVTKLELPALMGAANKHLGWNVPKHFAAKGIVRLVRNAVVHGSALPTSDSAELRRLFDKWKIFLFRRVLVRLGYAGKIASPHNGHESTSEVGDFSEEHNDFTAANANAPDPWKELVRKFREHQASETKAP